jgi:hypothetical protein
MASEQWRCLDADQPSGWTEGDFRAFVDTQRWIFARTMPGNPHEYTLRREAPGKGFDAAVRYVRGHGALESFAGKPYKVLHFQGRIYWTMGAELADTILINRKCHEEAPTTP